MVPQAVRMQDQQRPRSPRMQLSAPHGVPSGQQPSARESGGMGQCGSSRWAACARACCCCRWTCFVFLRRSRRSGGPSRPREVSKQATSATHTPMRAVRKCRHHHGPRGSARAQRFCTTSASSRQSSLGETDILCFFDMRIESVLKVSIFPSFPCTPSRQLEAFSRPHLSGVTLLRGRLHDR